MLGEGTLEMVHEGVWGGGEGSVCALSGGSFMLPFQPICFLGDQPFFYLYTER